MKIFATFLVLPAVAAAESVVARLLPEFYGPRTEVFFRPELIPTEVSLMPEFYGPTEVTLMPEFYGPRTEVTLMPEFYGPRTEVTLMPEFQIPEAIIKVHNNYESARTQAKLLPEFYNFQPSDGGVQFSRTVNTINHANFSIVFDKDCSTTDSYGSNDCNFNWGDKLVITYSGDLDEDITSGKLIGDLKVDNVFKLQFTCEICGANCTITVPVIKKTVSFPMPACPIRKARIPQNITSFTLPDKNPLGLGINVDGTVQITDQNAVTVALITVSAALSN